MRSKTLALGIAMSIAMPLSANAATFTDRSSFAQALSTSTTADFTKLFGGFYGGPGYDDGVGLLIDNGITVSTSTSYLFVSTANTYGTGTTAGAQQFSPTVVNFSFGADSTAFGFNYNADLPITLTIAGVTYNLAATSVNSLGFFGVTGLQSFRSAQISTTGAGSGIAFDNITFGQSASTSAVPEPATWAMMLIGFGAVGATMRRRKTTARIQFA